jgi:hypothetical protein
MRSIATLAARRKSLARGKPLKDALRFVDALVVAAIELFGCVGRYLGQIPRLNLVRDNMRVVELYGFGQ